MVRTSVVVVASACVLAALVALGAGGGSASVVREQLAGHFVFSGSSSATQGASRLFVIGAGGRGLH